MNVVAIETTAITSITGYASIQHAEIFLSSAFDLSSSDRTIPAKITCGRARRQPFV